MARRGDAALDALAVVVGGDRQAQTFSVQARRNAIWALSRIGTDKARTILRTALADPDPTVRQAAVHSLGTLKDNAARQALCQRLLQDEPPVRRAAATALSKLTENTSEETAKSVQALLEGIAREDNDDYLMHAQMYALIRLDNFDATLAGLQADNPQVRRAALIALDQMADRRLSHEMVIPLLNTSDQLLRTAAIDVITKHKDWADRIKLVAAGWLNGKQLSEEDATLALAVLKTFAGDRGIQPLMVAAMSSAKVPRETKLLILDALVESNLEAMPDEFVDSLKSLYKTGDGQLLERLVAVLSIKDTDKLDQELMEIARQDEQDGPLRLAALAIVANHGGKLDAADFQLLVDQFDDEVFPVDRIRAAGSLAGADLTKDQTLAVADLLGTVGPLELPVLMQRFERDTAPVVVNVDVQPAKAKNHRGVAAFLDEPQGHLATWNSWDPLSGEGFHYLRSSDGSYSGLSASKIEGAKLFPYNINRFDRLMGDFVYNGQESGGGEHQSFENHFILSGFKPDLLYDLYYYGSAYPKPNARGAEVTVTGKEGPVTKEIRGLHPEKQTL